jgi:phospholipid transport system substrate-binding protein
MRSSISSFFLKILKKIGIIFFLLFITFQETESETLASQTVVTLQKTLKEISQNESLDIFLKTLEAVKTLYDAKKMIQMIVGSQWSTITKEEKKKLTQVFEEYITSNYLKMFKKIKNPSFKLIDEKKIGNNYILIKTYLIINDHENVEINYLLIKNKNGWRIFDVLLAGSVSEIATKKSEFSKYLKNNDINKLINALKEIGKL